MNRKVLLAGAVAAAICWGTGSAWAAAPCDEPDTAGGGALGVSPGPVGPPSSLGWDVGSGQCNGSFTTVTDGGFPGGGLELALRAEERTQGQVPRTGANDYEVQTGDGGAVDRAWWNFQPSIAYDGGVDNLDSLTLTIRTDVGPNQPSAASFDLLGPAPAPCPPPPATLRDCIDDRNNQPNPTTTYADLYQLSQNPEFGWFTVAADGDANPTGAFDYDQPGAWLFTLTAREGGQEASVSMCVHTPGEACMVTTPVPGLDPRGAIVLAALLLALSVTLWRRRIHGSTS